MERVEFPSTLRRIGYGAFKGCHLREIRLPDSLEYIGKECFWGSGLT